MIRITIYVQLPAAWNRPRTTCANSLSSPSLAFFQSQSTSSAETRSPAVTLLRIPASSEISVLILPVYSATTPRNPLTVTPWYISPMILDVSTKHITPDTAIVAMSGALTLGTSLHAADTNLQNLIKAGTIKIVLDLSGVPYIDSAGLGAIVHAYGLAMEFHGKMRLCGINDKVASLLKMTRMDTFLAVDPDSATSLAALA